ncbi:MAG TPA: histone deacetylase [Candidatus Limnocylindrales bacterium]|nr:histone deacetylase [Candidatus Limnocylindrales bacterium]
MEKKTAFIYSDVYLKHNTGKSHPERKERLTAIVEHLNRTGLMEELIQVPIRLPTRQEITWVHPESYMDQLQRDIEGGATYLDPDTRVSPESYEVALQAVGGALTAVDQVLQGRVHTAFCAVRPPGHHAEPNKAMGFCLFNNVAIAARYAQHTYNLEKILIIDWDVHHGNGTQDIFYEDPTVFYFSIHQYPWYPGTGGSEERGAGKGKGFTLNIPVPAGTGDQEYISVFNSILRKQALAYAPDLILISAGFDAHRDDPLSHTRVTTEGFRSLSEIVSQIAQEKCDSRIVSVLEGGYNLQALAESVEAHLRVLRREV